MSALVELTSAVVVGLADEAVTATHFQELLDIVESTFAEKDPDRAEKLTKLYTDLESRITTAPASTRSYFHSAYSGGYLAHILRVNKLARAMANTYKKTAEGWVDFTLQELTFAALNHDLGKLGNDDGPYYVTQDSQWHRKTLGEMYKHNEEVPYYTVNDNTFYWLNKYEIKYTQKEMLGIKLADGIYDEGNKKYLMNNNVLPVRTALPYIVHWADHMATIAEKSVILETLEAE